MTRRLDTPLGLAALFALALGIRLAIAPHAGFYGDLQLFRQWAVRLARVGPHGFYAPGFFADYPPGYLYVLWLLGRIASPPSYLLLKLPAFAADLGLAWVAGLFARRLAPDALRERLPIRSLVAAAVLFNPAVLALGAVWGQVDAVPSFFSVSALLLLLTGRRTFQRDLAALVVFAIAVAMKPQAGFALPVLLYALYRRYVRGRAGGALRRSALRLAVLCGLPLALWLASGWPFGLGPVSLVRFYRHSSNVYPVTSANAFDLWGALGFWRNDSTGDRVLSLFGIPALDLGLLLLAAGIVLILWQVHRALERGGDEARVLTAAAAATTLLAFTVLTRMHERYLFYSLAALAPLLYSRPFRLAYAGLSALFLLSLWYPYANYNGQWHVDGFRIQPLFGWLLGSLAFDTWQKKVWSLCVVAIAVLLVRRGVGWAASARIGLPRPSLGALPRITLPSTGLRGTRWPLLVVGLACVFGLIALRGETSAASNLNDSAFHLQMVRWAGRQIGEGRVPLDGWFPYLSLGSSQFHHYQSLPHTLTAYAARATGAGTQTAYDWLLYLLLALWPISLYAAARLLGWEPWPSAAAAAVSPLLVSASGYGYEHGSYTWQGYGVYSQLWAMWTLPLAWALTWRTVAHGKRYAPAAAALAVTIAFHFITGYLAVLTVGVWVLVTSGAPLWQRALRGAVVVGGGFLVASWVLVPLIGDTRWTNESEYYTGTIFNDSYGARKILGWLVHGSLFDDGRFPVVTILFVFGLVTCLLRARDDLRARALLGAFTLSLLLFFGRPTIGPLLGLLPGMRDVQIHRFVIGVHLAGIFLAGVGLAQVLALARLLPLRRLVPAAAAALAVGLLAPAWLERASYDDRGARYIRAQQLADQTDGRALDRLVSLVKERGGGRVYAGLRGNWGAGYRVGSVPVHVWLANRDVDAIGFTFRTIASLSTDVEAAFDEASPAQYEMLNVRYLILPLARVPSVPATPIARSGQSELYEVRTSGYLQVVDRSAAIPADRTDVEAATRSWRESSLASRAIYPGIAWDGAPGPPATFAGAAPPAGSPGRVLSQASRLEDGVFSATVQANRTAVVLLKSTYDPRWTATVDGRPARPVMMAPSFVGVEVGPGRHSVRFRYAPYGHYPLLLALGALSLLGLAAVPRSRVRERLSGGLRGLRAPAAPAPPGTLRGPR